MSRSGPRSLPPAHWSSSSAPRLRLRRLISLASESSGAEATSARICGSPSAAGVASPLAFQTIPARLSAAPQTAFSTALGSEATAVSRRGAARTPSVPLTTQPPSARCRSASRLRRPDRVVAVTVTSGAMPSGAVSITRTRRPHLFAGPDGQPHHVLVQGQRADQGREEPAPMAGGPRGGIDRVRRPFRAAHLQGTVELAHAGAGELHGQVVEGRARTLRPVRARGRR